MFGISGFELLIIAVFVLLLFGPDKLPEIARTVSRFTREFKAARDAMEGMIRTEVYLADREERMKNAPDWTKSGERTKEWSESRAQSAEAPAPAALAADDADDAFAPIAIPIDENGNPIYETAESDDDMTPPAVAERDAVNDGSSGEAPASGGTGEEERA